MAGFRWTLTLAGAALTGLAALVCAEDSPQVSGAQIRNGSAIYAQNCAPCHGSRMRDPDAAFDLRKFPPDQKERFVNSVTKGKNQMPPFGDLFKPEDIDALWAYVMAGEK